MQAAFLSLPYVALRDAALDSIRKAIIGGKLKPGERILESQIAAQLGISRAPVREAIRQLESEGLLISLPHRGTYVIRFSAQDAYEVYSLRAVLEGFAVSLLASDPDEDVVAQLQECVNTMHQCAEAYNLRGMVEADICFHEILCQAPGHKRLFEVWMGMNTQIRAFVSLTNRQYLAPADIVARHQAVLDAIRAQLPDKARQLLSNDIMEAGQHVVEQLNAKANLNSPQEGE